MERSVGPSVYSGEQSTESWRWSSPLAWKAPARCVLAAALTLAINVPFGLLGYYQLLNPERAPYLDFDFLAGICLPFVVVYNACLLLLMGAGLFLGWRRSTHSGIVYVTALLIAMGSGVFVSYMFGQLTNPMGVGVLWATATIGLVLLDRRPVLIGLGACIGTLVVLTAVQQAGFLRYAPLFSGSPIVDGRLSMTWLLGTGGGITVVMLGLLAANTYIILNWHDREKMLADTSDQLAHANAVISRYVASQLVEQIEAGNYEEVERHERRKLTLFFSDIENFATIADEMEPEDLSELLNEYLSEMAAIGEQFGATIDKFIGDAIMIFFGAPTPIDGREQATRAVEMAIAMQRRMLELRRKWIDEGVEHPFQIRIGINTGQATVGNFGSHGRMDYTAIGRQVNLAARLQTACRPGCILLSHSTWSLVHATIDCDPQGELQVKGFSHPVNAYEVSMATLREPDRPS